MAPHHNDHVIPIKPSEVEQIEDSENILKPTPSRFEQLYLAPEQQVAGKLRFVRLLLSRTAQRC